MPRTFSDDLKDDVTNAFLTEFAESAMYHPKSGEARQVTVDCREQGSYPDDSNGGFVSMEVLEVRVSRDATDGIDAPQIGDRFLRAGETDYWKWHGEKSQVGPAMWTLTFQRESQFRVGGNLQR